MAASWIACPDGSYVQIAQLSQVAVVDDPAAGWVIRGYLPGFSSATTLKEGFASQAAATSALATAIGNLGGSV